MDRFGPSTLVEAGEQKFLFDAGRGALQRLKQLNVRWQDINGVFLTHLHSDHVVGFPDLWLTGWIVPPGRRTPLRVWGPKGTKNMTAHLRQAYQFDIEIRIRDDRVSPDGAILLTDEVREGVMFDQGGVKVIAFEVDHSPVKPAFGYRIEYAERYVVLSGDTRFSENLIRYGRGADLLIHEVVAPMSLRREGVPAERAQRIIAHHTTPEQAGEVFTRTKPRLAVYSHIVAPIATREDLIPPTRRTYNGPLELGEDLMEIIVGKEIEVRRPLRASQ
jgi:ribonuclease Z